MDIKLLNYKKENLRILSTECIFCRTCSDSCPKEGISTTIGFDTKFKEEINYKN